MVYVCASTDIIVCLALGGEDRMCLVPTPQLLAQLR